MQFIDGIAEMGHRFDAEVLERTKALARPLFAAPPAPPSSTFSYGDHARNTLDVYAAPTPNAPVFFYVPGGGFTGGEKDDGAFFYRNIGAAFSARGYTCVIPNYRLAPEFAWPSGGHDVDAALQWVFDNAGEHGGDTGRVNVCGQSAGATHVATAAFTSSRDQWQKVRSIALIGGLYSLEESPVRPNVRAYFGDDVEPFSQRLPLTLAKRMNVPMLFGVTGFETPAMAASTFAMAARMSHENGRAPDFLHFPRHNHVSVVYMVGTPYDDLVEPMIDFHRRTAR